MNTNTVLLRRLLLTIIIVLIASVLWLSFQAYQVTVNNQLTETSGPVLRNAFYAKAGEKGTIDYYNGDTFVSFNPKDNTLKPLTSLRGITDIANMYWTKDGVVFTVGTVAPWHPVWKLHQDYSSQRDGDSDPDSYSDDSVINNYHWYISFKDSSITLMSAGVDNAILFVTPTENGGLLFREFPHYSLLQPDGTIKRAVATLSSAEGDERRVIKVTAKEYIYLTEKADAVAVYSHDFAANKDNEIIPKLLSSDNHSIYSTVVMSGDDVYYLEPTGQGSVNSVHKINIRSKESSKLIDSFQGFINTSSSGTISAVHNGSEYTKLYNLTNMSKTLTIDKPLAQPHTLLNIPDSYFATNNGYIYKVGGTNVSPRPDVALEKKFDGSNGFVLTRNIEGSNDNSYTVTFANGTIADRMKQVYKAVEDAGYNPLEFSFTPNPGPRVAY